MLALICWGLAIALTLFTIGYCVRQYAHPLASPHWRWAWASQAGAHALLAFGWIWGYALYWWQGDALDLWWRPLLISTGFYGFNHWLRQIFLVPPEVLIEPMQPASVVLNAQGVIRQWDIHAQHLFGWSAGDALGQDFVALVVPVADQDRHRQDMQTWMAGQHGPGPKTRRLVPTQVVHKSGEAFTVEIVTMPIQGPGETLDFHKAIRKLIAL